MKTKTKAVKKKKTEVKEPKEIYYFAYGSCMSLKDIKRTTPAEFVSAATLYDYKLAFTRYSAGRKGGVADVVQSDGDYLEGVVFKIKNLKALDRREGHPYAYKRRKIKVLIHERMKFISVWTYEVVRKEEFEIKPSNMYSNLIREGARAFLSDHYNAELERNLRSFRPEYEVPKYVAPKKYNSSRYAQPYNRNERQLEIDDIDLENLDIDDLGDRYWEIWRKGLKERLGD